MRREPVLRRHAYWPGALSAFIRARADMPFAWGANDCCAFAAAAIEAMTGADLMRDVPPYSSAAEAALILKRPLEAWMDERLKRCAPAFAQRGDVGLVTIAGRSSLAIVDGHWLYSPDETRLARAPRAAALAAWAV